MTSKRSACANTCARCRNSHTLASTPGSSLYGAGTIASKTASVMLSCVANKVTSMPRSTNAFVRRLVTSSHGPYFRGGVRQAIGAIIAIRMAHPICMVYSEACPSSCKPSPDAKKSKVGTWSPVCVFNRQTTNMERPDAHRSFCPNPTHCQAQRSCAVRLWSETSGDYVRAAAIARSIARYAYRVTRQLRTATMRDRFLHHGHAVGADRERQQASHRHLRHE